MLQCLNGIKQILAFLQFHEKLKRPRRKIPKSDHATLSTLKILVSDINNEILHTGNSLI
jgi:hypothetical protein